MTGATFWRQWNGTPEERVARRLSVDGEHLLCSGARNGIGQPCLFIEHREVAVHRWLWEQQAGPIPAGHVLARTCDVERCVAPAHHELLSRGEQTLRANRARWGDDDACAQGHPWDEANTYVWRGNRYCRACRRDRQRRRRT